ncbi:M23 family metallopeptidase [Shimia biformata]|uniref:M23 family metallopeptidase n=1 Tax=Shimia biformata TaxID=1294299 RepID=UPI00194E7BC4|nr:M23 family metallopeptidase [Shimia biformata]
MRGLLPVLLLSATHAVADPLFGGPFDCPDDVTCFVQNYVDRDPGPGYADFTCGALSYDGHTGTDFAVPTRRAMHRGVPVLAARAGIVTGLRDGMPDSGFTTGTEAAISGRECGNGVVINHGQGWVTQYCHLQNGSIAVANGQKVAAGERLGLIGQSGKAAFPHLHFTIRKNGTPVDPFAPNSKQCGAGDEGTLWAEPVTYQAGGLIGVALSDHIPNFDRVKQDGGGTDVTTRSPAIVLVAHAFGARKGDELSLLLEGPEGVIVEQTIQLDKTQARLFRASGRKARGPWPTGGYHGHAVLTRGDAEISAASIFHDLR